MNKKIIWGVVVIIIIALIVWGTKSSGPKAPDVTNSIKIGAIVSLSGDAAINGEDMKKGMDLAKKELSARGVKVDIDYQDDQTNPKESVSVVQKILATNKPDVFVGPIWSFLLDAAIPVIDQAKIVTLSPCSSSEYINVKSPYVFFGYVRNALKAGPATVWLKEMNAKNVAVIVSKDAWGDSNEKAFIKAVADAGASVVFTERIPFGGADSMSTIMSKIKASKADAVLWTGYDDGATVFIKKMHELNLDVPVLATDAFKSVVNKGIVSVNRQDKVYVFETPKDDQFAEKFKKEYGVAPGECADNAYDGLMILVDAVQHAKDGQIVDYLRDTTNYDGYAHQYDFDQTGDVTGGEWLVKKLGQ